MVVLPAGGADLSAQVRATLRDRPGPITVMTVAVSTPLRPVWTGDLGGAAWRNAVAVTKATGRGVAVKAQRGRLDDVVRNTAALHLGLIVVPGGGFPAAEVDRLARRVAPVVGLDLAVLGPGAPPGPTARPDDGRDVEAA